MDSEPRDVERVRVAVRVRPRNAREEALEPSQHAMDVDAAAGQIYVCKKKPDSRSAVGAATGELATDRELRCSFDRVFAASATQDDVFDYVRDAVQQVAQGFNCTIFAYGQTGTGKTHTMLGRDLEKNLDAIGGSGSVALSSTSREAWGVIPRAVESLFDELASIARHGAAAAVVHCSYMQIYNNEVYDLLQENRARMKEPLAVREMIKGNDKQVFVSGLSEFRVASLDETLRLLKQGNRNRTVRATEYNEKSSRSHALLQLSAEVESRGAEGPATIIRRAKLSLVDLAGSEKWATGDAAAMGADRCKELTSINQSLSALGNVISALANRRRTHVPYRDAKLTRLLQDSLGGNTRTTVLATISPDASAIEETISTLLFAERAKCVALRVKANEVVDDAVLLAQARREIARLTLQLKKNAPPHAEQLHELEQKVARLTREITALVSENKRLRQQAAAAAKKNERDKGGSLVGAVGADPPPSMARQPSPSVRRPQETTPRTPADEDTRAEPSRPRPPSTRTLVIHKVGQSDEDAENSEDARRAREEARDQTLLLEQIQSERRALEQELERLEQQTPRLALPHAGQDNNGTHDGEDDEDACPICRRNIDDHTDDELDACIERETAVVQTRDATPETSPPPEEPSRPPVRPTPTTPQTPPPGRKKPTTPRATGSVKKPASPYLQDLFSKAAAAAASPTPTQVGLTLIGEPPPSRHRRSARQSETGAGSARESEDQQRPSTADAHAKANGSSYHQPEAARSLANPIVHQGSKSVKALKKFQATSPYNSVSKASATKAKPAAGSPPRHATTSNNSNGSPTASSAEPEDRVVGSLRDIGLSLMVYKFRYDCWYPCTVVGFDAKRQLHCCQYEYGDKQWQDLVQNKVKVVGRSGQNQ